ncbi:hypothetical protein HYALB_00005653 [Hymenoscyphus albidus]|uniref:Heterokaryon incompatibility domain-containing protein n=1 Tax=Hymenoscyphus albidus TaxID=595503 RepID=A0A9N9LJR2_9HELO|nr:hypothetical protein HYALB_00005653 [Hymenoscyphus albidus]
MENQPYEYEPLDDSTDEIRLISIHLDSDPDSSIQLDIIRAKLSENPEYEALSYMWGSERDPHDVYVSGKRLRIGHNLWMALLRLRNPTKARVVWVDAICIDQNNTSERNHQVSQMSKIYRQASRVVGPTLGDTGGCISQRSDFYYGNIELEWASFAALVRREMASYADRENITRKTPMKLIQQRVAQSLTKHGQNLNFTSSSIVDLALSFSESECPDRRDKIFGLMSLANDCCKTHTHVDYSMTGLELCQSVLDHYANSHSPTKIIRRLEVVIGLYSTLMRQSYHETIFEKEVPVLDYIDFFDRDFGSISPPYTPRRSGMDDIRKAQIREQDMADLVCHEQDRIKRLPFNLIVESQNDDSVASWRIGYYIIHESRQAWEYVKEDKYTNKFGFEGRLEVRGE